MTSLPPLRLGPWAVEPDLLRISQEGDSRRLGPKVMAVLLDLGQRPGQVVTKEELIERIWDGAFTSDEAVSAVVYELRKALDDSARSPRFLETIRGSGYRLLVPLTSDPKPLDDGVATSDGVVDSAAEAPTAPRLDLDASVVGAESGEASAVEAESDKTGIPETGVAETEVAETEVAETGVAETGEAEEAPGSLAPSAPGRELSPSSPRRKAVLVTLALLGAVTLLITGALLAGWRDRPPGNSQEEASDTIRSLAVLPLGTFNEEERQDLFASALTDMLISDVAQLCPVEVSPGLAVRGRQGRWNLDQASRVLGVDAVLEGSVLRTEDRFWISVQLVDTQTGRMLWSRSYDRDVGDELLVLREVALEIAGEIQRLLAAAS